MLRYLRQQWRSCLIAFLCVAFAAIVVCFSDAFQQCMNKAYYESSDYEPPKGIAQILAALGWAKVCTGEFLKVDGEAITAFFTLVVGFFTAALWASTDKLWRSSEYQIKTSRQVAAIQARQTRISNREAKRAADAASRNAKAFMSAERAYLFIQINEETASDIVSKFGRYNQSADMFDEELDTPSVGYSFKNFGRTAAILKEFSDQLIFATDFPNVSEYSIRESMPDELVVEPGAPAQSLAAC